MTADRNATAGFVMNDYARIGDTPYGTLNLAYAAAHAGDIIKAQGMVFTGGLTLDRAVAVTLQGGYSSGFGSRSGYTTLGGKLTINSGSVVVDRVVVK
jgi:hypothetical protein